MNAYQLTTKHKKSIQPLLDIGLRNVTTDCQAKNGTLTFNVPSDGEHYTLNIDTGYVRRFSNTSPYRKQIAYPLNYRPSYIEVCGRTIKHNKYVRGGYVKLYNIDKQVELVLRTQGNKK